MGREDFERFVQRKNKEKEAGDFFDKDKQLKEWREYLASLYAAIDRYLKPYMDDGSINITYKTIKLFEEFYGEYEIDAMLLRIGSSEILFEPIGTMLIGAKGRVDVQGPGGTARLSLINKSIDNARQMFRVQVNTGSHTVAAPEPPPVPQEIEWVWKISTPPPDMKFITLNEDVFFDMILSIADA